MNLAEPELLISSTELVEGEESSLVVGPCLPGCSDHLEDTYLQELCCFKKRLCEQQ